MVMHECDFSFQRCIKVNIENIEDIVLNDRSEISDKQVLNLVKDTKQLMRDYCVMVLDDFAFYKSNGKDIAVHKMFHKTVENITKKRITKSQIVLRDKVQEFCSYRNAVEHADHNAITKHKIVDIASSFDHMIDAMRTMNDLMISSKVKLSHLDTSEFTNILKATSSFVIDMRTAFIPSDSIK